MSEYHLAAQLWFESTEPETPDDFARFMDRVESELDKIAAPVSIAADLHDKMIDFAGVFTATSREAARAELLGYVRTALHAAECVTADWPVYREARQTVEELQDA